MHFKFVEISLSFEYNQWALVLLDDDRNITHYAYQGEFRPIGTYCFNRMPNQNYNATIQFVYDSLFFDENYSVWKNRSLISESYFQGINQNPIEELLDENTSGLHIQFANITTTAKFLWRCNHNYGSKMSVRNKSALIVKNSEDNICFIAQGYKFNYVLPSEVTINQVYMQKKDVNILKIKHFEFDTQYVWLKI